MHLDELKEYMCKKPCVKIDFPFGEEYMVFKLLDKMFALISLEDEPLRMNLKCDPEDAIGYREIYNSVIAGYHMNKKHWNTIILDGEVSNEVLKEMIDASFELVRTKLSKKQKDQVNAFT